MLFLRYASGQTDKLTKRNADCNTLHPYWGWSKHRSKVKLREIPNKKHSCINGNI